MKTTLLRLLHVSSFVWTHRLSRPGASLMPALVQEQISKGTAIVHMAEENSSLTTALREEAFAFVRSLANELSEGKVERAREKLMAWCTVALSLEFFQRGQTIAEINFDWFELVFSALERDGFYAIIAHLDLTGEFKVERRTGIVDKREFMRVSSAPPPPRALNALSQLP